MNITHIFAPCVHPECGTYTRLKHIQLMTKFTEDLVDQRVRPLEGDDITTIAGDDKLFQLSNVGAQPRFFLFL